MLLPDFYVRKKTWCPLNKFDFRLIFHVLSKCTKRLSFTFHAGTFFSEFSHFFPSISNRMAIISIFVVGAIQIISDTLRAEGRKATVSPNDTWGGRESTKVS